jgi:hypothetical protein
VTLHALEPLPAPAARIPWPEDEPTVPLWPDAARAFSIGRSQAYALASSDDFPCPVLRIGSRWRVPTAALRGALGLPVSQDWPA